MGNVLVTVSIQDQAAAALDGVEVGVYASNGTTFITQGFTGAPFAAGTVEFTLPGNNPATAYILRFFKAGYRFSSNGQRVTVLVTDPPATNNNFGPYVATLGSTAVVVRIDVVDEDDVPLDGVAVRIYNASDAFQTEGETGAGDDATGEMSIALAGSLSGTTYIVRLFAGTRSIDGGMTQTILVLDPATPENVFDFVARTIDLPQPTDVDMCRVYGKLVDSSLRPIRNRTIEFVPVPAWPDDVPRLMSHFFGDPSVIRNMIVAGSTRAITSAAGVVDVELPRGGVYKIRVGGLEHPVYITEPVFIPDRPTVAFEELLFPFVVSVAYAGTPANMAVGDSATVTLTIVASNGQNVVSKAALLQLLEFASSDGGVLNVVVSDDQKLTLTALAAGSASITVTRRDGTVAPRRPSVPSITVTPPTVVVT